MVSINILAHGGTVMDSEYSIAIDDFDGTYHYLAKQLPSLLPLAAYSFRLLCNTGSTLKIQLLDKMFLNGESIATLTVLVTIHGTQKTIIIVINVINDITEKYINIDQIESPEIMEELGKYFGA